MTITDTSAHGRGLTTGSKKYENSVSHETHMTSREKQKKRKIMWWEGRLLQQKLDDRTRDATDC
jgi:hypothetical protein